MANLHETPAKGNNSIPALDLGQGQLAIVNTQHVPRSSRDDRFDWSRANPDILLPQQPATAVYQNGFDQVVIRQEDQFGDSDSEMWVVINLGELPTLIARLQDIAAENA
jgi:hypothetical protein